MRQYRFSLTLMAAMAVLSMTARDLTPLIARMAGPRFLPILALALVSALLLLSLIRSPAGRSDLTLPPLILAGAAMVFLLASRPVTHLQVMAAGCFFLGAVVRFEGKRRFPLPGMIMLLAAALLLEAVLLLKTGGRFLPMNSGVHFVAAMSGFCAAPSPRR